MIIHRFDQPVRTGFDESYNLSFRFISLTNQHIPRNRLILTTSRAVCRLLQTGHLLPAGSKHRPKAQHYSLHVFGNAHIEADAACCSSPDKDLKMPVPQPV
ncbi:hypothetical protein PM082_019319 [Marasmius tenuissimus]|nr:hypothetical protein PM082_019319 [Marasmius tenuissimus]